MQAQLGFKPLPSEGPQSLLALVADRGAQRMLRHTIRRPPTARWPAAKVADSSLFKTIGLRGARPPPAK